MFTSPFYSFNDLVVEFLITLANIGYAFKFKQLCVTQAYKQIVNWHKLCIELSIALI